MLRGFAFLLLLSACDGSGLSSVLPKMVLVPQERTPLVFEAVAVDRVPGPISVLIKNEGGGLLEIQRVYTEGSERFTVAQSEENELLPGEQTERVISFELNASGALTAELIIESNDPKLPRAVFPLDGRSSARCVPVVEPGSIEVAFEQPTDFTLSNLGLSACTLIEIDDAPSIFPLTPRPELPAVVEPRGRLRSAITQVRYTQSIEAPTHDLVMTMEDGQTITPITGRVRPPCLSLTTPAVRFEITALGTRSEANAVVENNCEWDYQIASARFFDDAPSTFEFVGVLPIEVPAHSSAQVALGYRPVARVIEETRIRLSTDDPLAVTMDVALTGQGGAPVPFVFPRNIDFQSVIFQNPAGPDMHSECGARGREVQVHNIGDLPLIIEGFSFSQDGLFELVSAVLDDAPLPDFMQGFTIAPGSAAKLALAFHPTRGGVHAGVLSIQTNSVESPIQITLGGLGVPAGPITDRFSQPEGPKVDILWAIDNSCSMEDEQNLLVENLSNFVGYADGLNADYQMAVTVADSEREGAGGFELCPPHPPIIRSDYATTPARDEAFGCLFEVGTNGGLREAGLGASLRALERAMSADQDPMSNPNAGFVRSDAKLAIVVISDEDDQSLEPNELMRDFFFSTKGGKRNDLVSVHAIAGPPSGGCNTADPGLRYLWMTQETGGGFQDICARNWGSVLTNLGLTIFTLFDEWALSASADPGSIVVMVDGAPVPADMADGYVFDVSSNTVRFFGASVPPAGAEVEISYSGLCRP